MNKKLFVPAIIFLLLGAGCNVSSPAIQQNQAGPAEVSKSAQEQPFVLKSPIDRVLQRLSKKPFGLKVSPGHSPVSPERFSGFHTGADFETFPEEQDRDVPIFAVCDGQLLLKKSASGYGGGAMQSCHINSQDVTVIYGHLRLSSIAAQAGQEIGTGQQLAVLGQGASLETDGERKHLHLGIHKGTNIDLRGYVQKQSELDGWIDPEPYLK